MSDPRHHMYLSTVVEAMAWELPYGDDPLFFGRVFGDGSCKGPLHRGMSRAGFSVVQLDSLQECAGIRTCLRGNLPHRIQENSGAELFAVLQWFRHLSPIHSLHEYCVDSQWVLDGFCQVYNALDPWTPFWSIWKQVLDCKS